MIELTWDQLPYIINGAFLAVLAAVVFIRWAFGGGQND